MRKRMQTARFTFVLWIWLDVIPAIIPPSVLMLKDMIVSDKAVHEKSDFEPQ